MNTRTFKVTLEVKAESEYRSEKELEALVISIFGDYCYESMTTKVEVQKMEIEESYNVT